MCNAVEHAVYLCMRAGASAYLYVHHAMSPAPCTRTGTIPCPFRKRTAIDRYLHAKNKLGVNASFLLTNIETVEQDISSKVTQSRIDKLKELQPRYPSEIGCLFAGPQEPPTQVPAQQQAQQPIPQPNSLQEQQQAQLHRLPQQAAPQHMGRPAKDTIRQGMSLADMYS